MILREVILYVQGESKVVPNTLSGGLALASVLFIVALLQACTLQHFIHGGSSRTMIPNTTTYADSTQYYYRLLCGRLSYIYLYEYDISCAVVQLCRFRCFAGAHRRHIQRQLQK